MRRLWLPCRVGEGGDATSEYSSDDNVQVVGKLVTLGEARAAVNVLQRFARANQWEPEWESTIASLGTKMDRMGLVNAQFIKQKDIRSYFTHV